MKTVLICLFAFLTLNAYCVDKKCDVQKNPDPSVAVATTNVRMDYISMDRSKIYFVLLASENPPVTRAANGDLMVWVDFEFIYKTDNHRHASPTGGYLIRNSGGSYYFPTPSDWQDVKSVLFIVNPNQGNLKIDITEMQRWYSVIYMN